MSWLELAVLSAAFGLAACGNDAARGAAPDAGGDARGEDARSERDELCPDPSDVRVHYRSDDAIACKSVVLDCTIEQNGFSNACGCGCIDKGDASCPASDDGNIMWVSRNPAECAPEPPACGLNEIGFSNTCGCGCKQPS